MDLHERLFFKIPVADQKMLKYREIAKILVEDLMDQVKDKKNVFAKNFIIWKYQRKCSSWQYEIDYLIQYDISANSKISEISSYPGFVRIILCDDEEIAKYESMMEDGVLSCNKLMFSFLLHAYRITAEQSYRSQEQYLQLAVKFNSKTCRQIEVTEKNFRKITSVGAALPFRVENDSIITDETVDVVLSFHCHGDWPECADIWKRKYKDILKKECFDAVIEGGVSMVCKVPVADIGASEITDVFRLSFSAAEAILFDFATPEQREAYKMLKILRMNIKKYTLKNLDIGDELMERFTSYHLKSVFFRLTTGNYKQLEVRQWLILLLEQVIICLRNQSIKHFFIDDLELLTNSLKIFSIKGTFKENLMQTTMINFDDYIKSVPQEFLIGNCCLRTYDILERLFEHILKTLPEDLSKLSGECKYKDEVNILPPLGP